MNIRPIQDNDLDELAQIYTQTYTFFDVGERWTKETSYDMLRYWLKRQPDLCFLAERDIKMVGAFFVGVKPWWDGNHLVDGEIFVHPDYQKQQVGTGLLKHVFEVALKKYDIVRWDTYTVKDKYPLEWYKSLGFSEIQEWVMISGDPKQALEKLKAKTNI